MKKNLFYLFALICSMSLFTACSDDEEPWKELPKGELSSDKVELTLNGAATDGTVNFEALGAEKAQVQLKNVIDGYSDVKVDVDMKEQADGSFSFSGTQQIATKPVTRSVAQQTPFLTVTVNGTVFKEGAVNLNVTTQGMALYLGTYAGETLVLNCNGSTLEGKTVVLDASVGDKANFLLGGVLPGEPEAVLADVPFNGNSFSGKVATALYDVEVSGSKADKVLTLNLKATLNEAAQGGLAGTWNLSLQYPYTVGDMDMETWEYPRYVNPYPPIRLNWTALDNSEGKKNADQFSMIVSNLCSHLLPEVLQSISLANSNALTASYYPQPMFDWIYDMDGETWVQNTDPENAMMSWMMNALLVTPSTTPEEAPNAYIPVYERTWLSAPSGLVSWYVKGDCIYIVPDIAAIMKQIGADQGGSTAGEFDLKALLDQLTKLGIGEDKLMALLPQIQGWMTTGIPLKYKQENGVLTLYIDKEMAAPFMELLLPILPALWEKVVASDTTGMINMALFLLGLEDISDLQTIWETNTDQFTISLNFTAAGAASSATALRAQPAALPVKNLSAMPAKALDVLNKLLKK